MVTYKWNTTRSVYTSRWICFHFVVLYITNEWHFYTGSCTSSTLQCNRNHEQYKTGNLSHHQTQTHACSLKHLKRCKDKLRSQLKLLQFIYWLHVFIRVIIRLQFPSRHMVRLVLRHGYIILQLMLQEIFHCCTVFCISNMIYLDLRLGPAHCRGMTGLPDQTARH